MPSLKKILLQTTIENSVDDWNVGRFSMMHEHLASLKAADGSRLYDIVARDRENDEVGNDPVLSTLGESDFDQLWLFAVDTGDGLSGDDCAGITRFRQRGGGILSTRDHHDLGSSLCTLGGVGAAHYFNSKNPDPDETRRTRDDAVTLSIDHPNYHSGANGDYQLITPVGPVHDVLRREDGSAIMYFPAHPHEGGVGAPAGSTTDHVIAMGKSKVTGRSFNLVVALDGHKDEHGNPLGRAIAESSFHHFCDYNWDTDAGCPTFVEEPPGTGFRRNPAALADIKTYVANVASWLCL